MARRPHHSAPLLALLALLARAPAVGGGRVFAVGSNGCGQLGDGTRTSAATPTEITSGYDPTTRGRVNLTNAVRQVDASSGADPEMNSRICDEALAVKSSWSRSRV